MSNIHYTFQNICAYICICVYIHVHTHEVLFSPWEGRSSMTSWVWRRENPPSVPRAPLQRCRNCCWGASQWPRPRWTLCSTGLSRSALRRAGVFPLDNTVWVPWAHVVAWSRLCLGRRARWISWRSSFPVASFLPSMAALLVGRGPSLLQKAELRHCLALFHEANEKILLTYLSSISVPGMRAPKTGIEPWVFWQSYRRCQNYGAETHGAFCALDCGSEQQWAQRLWKEQPWLRSEIQMGYLGLEGSSCLFYEVKILLRYAQTT